MKNALLSKSLLLAAGLSLYACGGGEPKKDTNEDTAKVSEVKENLQKVLTDIPKPSELPYELKNTGADWNANFPNNPKNAEKYKTTDFKAALNLGVFATDVGYVSVYGKVQNAIDYIKAVKELGDKLGVSASFDPKLQERFEKNLKNLDSLTAILNESLAKSDKYLKDNQQSRKAALIFAGTFMEGLYISTQLVSTYPKDLLPEDAKNQVLIGIVNLIVKQDKPLNDLINALKALEKDADNDKLIGQLEDLAKVYKTLDLNEKIKKNQGNLIITDKNIQAITEKVKAIRSEIVG